MSILARWFDERFLTHRLRSTSIAGIASAILAMALFEYRFFVDRRWNWDLLAVALAFLVLKLSMMAWYHITD